jgi:hypothetical protein
LAFEAPTLIPGLDDGAVMGQAIQQRGAHRVGGWPPTRAILRGDIQTELLGQLLQHDYCRPAVKRAYTMGMTAIQSCCSYETA